MDQITAHMDCKLNSCLFSSVTRLSRELGRRAEEAFYRTGLSPSHAVLLYLINRQDGIRQKDVGDLLHLTPSTITRLIEKLERKGYVTKHPEGKNVRLRTTPAGLAMQKAIIDAWNQLQNAYRHVLTGEETARFLSISDKLLGHLTNAPIHSNRRSQTMDEIFIRRSIRKFTEQPVEPEKIDRLLRAAMQAPSAANRQAWEFIVVQNRETLSKLSVLSPYATPAAGSAVTFVLLTDENRLKQPVGWEQDMGAAAENMLLEAVHLGLGGVWLGIATSPAAMEQTCALFHLPAHILPFALVSVGYPDGQKNTFIDRYQADRVHYEKW